MGSETVFTFQFVVNGEKLDFLLTYKKSQYIGMNFEMVITGKVVQTFPIDMLDLFPLPHVE